MSDHEPVTTSERIPFAAAMTDALDAAVMEAVTRQESSGKEWVELTTAVAKRLVRQLRSVEAENAALAAQVDRLERERRAAVEDLTETQARLEDLEAAAVGMTPVFAAAEAERRSAVATRVANRQGLPWGR